MAVPQTNPRTVQAPPELPSVPGVPDVLANYLRNFALWTRHGFADKVSATTASGGSMLQGHDAGADVPNVFKLQVSQAGIASLAPMALGRSDPAGTGTPVPLVNEAPATGTFARSGSAWVATVPASGGAFSGAIYAPSATITGALNAATGTLSGLLSAASAAITGALSAGATTLTGALSGTTGTFSGLLSAAGATLTAALNGTTATLTGLLTTASLRLTSTTAATQMQFTTLPVNAATDAAAATAGVPVGGVYRNGSVLMVRTV